MMLAMRRKEGRKEKEKTKASENTQMNRLKSGQRQWKIARERVRSSIAPFLPSSLSSPSLVCRQTRQHIARIIAYNINSESDASTKGCQAPAKMASRLKSLKKPLRGLAQLLMV